MAGWIDISGNVNDAEQLTASQMPTFTQTEGPISFDDDSLDCGVKSPSSAMSIVFKINTATFGSRVIISSKEVNSDTDGFLIRPNSATVMRLYDSAAAGFYDFTGLSSYSGINTNFALTINGTTAKLFQEGVLVGTKTLTTGIVQSIENVHIGSRTGGSQDFEGSMDGMYMFPTELDITKVNQMKDYIDGL